METIVDDFRPRAARWLAALGAVALVPFSIFDLIAGKALVAVVMLALTGTLSLGVWLLGKGIYHPLHVVAVFGAPAIAVNAIGASRVGVFGTYWSFVIAMAFYLVLPRRWATVLAGVLIGVMAPIVWAQHGANIGSRYAVCLTLVSLFGLVTVGLVDDRQRLLVERANTDPLTGALNRMTLATRLAAVTARPAGILALDVDHFKAINDRFGHDAGDRVLEGLVTVLRSHLRADTPLFRLGGEEFLVLVEGVDLPAAAALARRLVDSVAAHPFLDGHTVTISTGIAAMRDGETTNDWLRRADEALYQAKSAGRNTLAVA